MIYLFENISYNHSLGTVNKDGEEFKLTKIQKKLLKYLLDNPQEVIPKQVLMDQVWERTVTENSIDQRVANLRSIVEIDRTNPKIISTNFGQGIFLNCEVKVKDKLMKTDPKTLDARMPTLKLLVSMSTLLILLLLTLIYWSQFRVEPVIGKSNQQISREDYMNQFPVDKRQSVDEMFAGLPQAVRKKFRRYLSKLSDGQQQELTLKLLEMTDSDRIQFILSL